MRAKYRIIIIFRYADAFKVLMRFKGKNFVFIWSSSFRAPSSLDYWFTIIWKAEINSGRLFVPEANLNKSLFLFSFCPSLSREIEAEQNCAVADICMGCANAHATRLKIAQTLYAYLIPQRNVFPLNPWQNRDGVFLLRERDLRWWGNYLHSIRVYLITRFVSWQNRLIVYSMTKSWFITRQKLIV